MSFTHNEIKILTALLSRYQSLSDEFLRDDESIETIKKIFALLSKYIIVTQRHTTYTMPHSSILPPTVISLEIRLDNERLIVQAAEDFSLATDTFSYTFENLCDNAARSLEEWIKIAKDGTTYTVKDILRLRNIEQRRAALKIMGADRLIQESNAKLISRSARGNELYIIPQAENIFDTDAYFLKYSCVSTGRIYVSGVPPQLFDMHQTIAQLKRKANRVSPFEVMNDIEIEEMYAKDYPPEEWADLAMAWKFRLSLEDYKKLTIENEG